jgi:hypothetical protein
MKIFLSSTAYDLKDFRALIVDILESKGHDVLYHESPIFPAKLGLHSHDQCILAVEDCDLVLCLVDKRYGGKYSGSFRDRFLDQTFKVKGLDRYGKSKSFKVTIISKELSITWCELITAYASKKYIITFARQTTLDEKETRRANQHLATFRPAFVEKNEVFDFLDWITKQPTNNWIASFNTIVDFKTKFEKWIDELEKTIIPDSQPRLLPGERKKIGIIVEGEVDRYIINKIISYLELDAEFAIIPIYGKYRILNEFKTIVNPYLNLFDNVFIVLDSDTKSKSNIRNQRKRLETLLTTKQKSKVKFVLVTPSIESWLMAGLNTDQYREYNGMIDKDLFIKLTNIPSVKNVKQILETEYNVSLALDNDHDLREFIEQIRKVIARQ